MQAFLNSLTAALLFIHAVFGCCWHHAHACGKDCASAVTKPAPCCHHHQRCDDGKQPERPCKCNFECEGTCTYILPQKVKVDAPQSITLDLLAVLPSLADRQIEAASSWETVSSLPDWAPPLRTHLLHQVLLN
jgi:hypothetical protein